MNAAAADFAENGVVEYGPRRLFVVAVMLATLLEMLDSTIVDVALPTITIRTPSYDVVRFVRER